MDIGAQSGSSVQSDIGVPVVLWWSLGRAGQGMAPVSWPGLSEMRCVVTAEAAQPTLSPILLHDPSHLIDT